MELGQGARVALRPRHPSVGTRLPQEALLVVTTSPGVCGSPWASVLALVAVAAIRTPRGIRQPQASGFRPSRTGDTVS